VLVDGVDQARNKASTCLLGVVIEDVQADLFVAILRVAVLREAARLGHEVNTRNKRVSWRVISA